MTEETTPTEPTLPDAAPAEPTPAPSAEEPYRPPIETPPEPVVSEQTLEPEPEAPPAPRMIEVAVLDAAGIYQGTTEIPEADLTDEHVRLDGGCDLPPDAYRWDAARKTFVFAGSPTQQREESPHTLNAMAWAMLAMRVQITLPAKALRWLDWYVTTLDFAGTWESQDEAALVADYRRERGIK